MAWGSAIIYSAWPPPQPAQGLHEDRVRFEFVGTECALGLVLKKSLFLLPGDIHLCDKTSSLPGCSSQHLKNFGPHWLPWAMPAFVGFLEQYVQPPADPKGG